jgi:hypothetical protein
MFFTFLVLKLSPKFIVLYEQLSTAQLYFKVANAVQNLELLDAGKVLEGLAIKANKTDVDGQWVAKHLELMTSFPAGSQQFDLSEYLPNDGYIYEVMVSGYGATGTSSGNYISIFVSSDIQPLEINLFRAITRTSSTAFGGGSIIFPVRKTISIANSGNASSGTNVLALRAYRRLGTNV